MIISSKSNSKVKEIRALRQRKGREAAQVFIVEGIRPIGEAVDAGAEIDSIFYSPDRLHSEFGRNLVVEVSKAGIPCLALSKDVFESISSKENPQGILAIVRSNLVSLDHIHPQNFQWGIALVAPQDPGNIGTILRTIDAVGANGIILLDTSADPTHPSVVRASMGTIFWYPIVHTNFDDFKIWAQKYEYYVLGTSSHAQEMIDQVKTYPRPLILLLGSEREGLSKEHLDICNQVIRLPMHGRATSLNLSVAAGVFLYDILFKS